MQLTGIFIYPVKSCRGIALPEVEFDAVGLKHDRRFLIVDDTGRFLTQRSVPPMARIATAVGGGELTLSADGAGGVRVPLLSPEAPAVVERRSVVIWKDTVEADDCGAEAATWLTNFLGQPARLVRIGDRYHRPVRKSPTDLVAFNDAYPVLVISQASLEHLNDKLDVPVPMDRFRPNFVIDGATSPHAEDGWPRLQLGAAVVLRSLGNCARCIVITTDQLTGERGKEPLRTLAGYRRRPNEPEAVDFGQNCVVETKTGRVRLGDPVTVLPAA